MRIKLHLLLAFGLLVKINFAQQPVFRHISKYNGLPSNTIYDMKEDKNGFIWLGTEKGLVRFDGKNTVVYTHAKMNGTAVSNIIIDGIGRIWCQNFTGQHFYVLNDSMVYPELKNTGTFNITYINKQNDIFIISNSMLYIYNKQLILKDSIGIKDFVNSFVFKNNYYIIESTKLSKVINGKKTLNSTFDNKNNKSGAVFAINKNHVFFINKSSADAILFQLFPTFNATKLFKQTALIQTLNITNDSLLWINTTAGCYIYNFQLKPMQFEKPLFKNNSISAVIKDRNGAYWISTTNNGIYIIEDLHSKQINFNNENITTINNINHQIVVGTSSGEVGQLNSSHNEFKQIFKTDILHRINFVKFDSINNRYLIGADKVYGLSNKKKDFNFNIAAKDVCLGEHNEYLLAASSSLANIIKHKQQGNWSSFYSTKSIWNSFCCNIFDLKEFTSRSKAIEISTDFSTLYVASAKGLLSVSQNKISEIQLNGATIAASDLFINKDTLYASTYNQGILMIINNKVIKFWDKSNSIINQTINKIRYWQGKIWLISDNNLYTINLTNFELKNHFKSNSFFYNELNDIAFNNNFLYVASNEGVIQSPINQEITIHKVPNLFIESIKVNDKILNQNVLNDLRYNQNNITINFATPWFSSENRLQIFYNINNSNWQKFEKGARILSLSSLSPGNYFIQFKTCIDGQYFSPIAHVSFQISYPIWQQAWFLIIAFLLLATLFFAIYKYRLKLINRQSKLLIEKNKLETDLQKSMLSSIKSQMNPHFIFNALNTIQSYIYLNDKENASNYLAQFSMLTRKILDMSNSETVTLADEIETLQLYLSLEKMRFEDSLNYEITIAPNLNVNDVKIPSMLIQPYVENALKHGLLHKKTNRNLSVVFEQDSQFLIIKVDDNGVGRKKANELNSIKDHKFNSFSTEANQKRLTLLNKQTTEIGVNTIDKFDKNGIAEGTLVVLKIPLSVL
ncbi:MAG: histidine kinase [Bacteroidia bacterium]